MAVGCSDLLCAAGVLYVLLPPQAAIGFAAFAGLYLIAIAAGVISNVPGGVGVFESVLLLLFRTVPADHLLGALLAYRIIYYFVPFGLALGLLGWHEIWVHRGPMVRLGRLVRSWASAVTPQASAIAVFGAGGGVALLRRHAGHRQPHGLAAQLRPAAHPGVVASAGQCGRRGAADPGERPVPPARCGLVAHHLAAVRGRPPVVAQGFRLRRGDHLGPPWW